MLTGKGRESSLFAGQPRGCLVQKPNQGQTSLRRYDRYTYIYTHIYIYVQKIVGWVWSVVRGRCRLRCRPCAASAALPPPRGSGRRLLRRLPCGHGEQRQHCSCSGMCWAPWPSSAGWPLKTSRPRSRLCTPQEQTIYINI